MGDCHGGQVVLDDAREDFKLLLDRGYRRDSALSFVGDHHHLDVRARNRLSREVYSDAEISDTESKIIPIEDIRGLDVAIDGFNVLITVETGLSGGEVFLCQDGIVRDNSMVFSNYRISERTMSAAEAVISILSQYSPMEALWVFDSQISGSGRLAEYVRRGMESVGVRGRSTTSPSADEYLLRLGMLTATSDTRLIRRLDAVVDLPQAVFVRLSEWSGGVDGSLRRVGR